MAENCANNILANSPKNSRKIATTKLFWNNDFKRFLCLLAFLNYFYFDVVLIIVVFVQEPAEGPGAGAADQEPAGPQGVRLQGRGRVPTVSTFLTIIRQSHEIVDPQRWYLYSLPKLHFSQLGAFY